ncbi:MAG: hypothetical protein U5K69_07175 [Balneolaceae bacterium]|nr:hypothetical protein [Balneolaceae bacterium]
MNYISIRLKLLITCAVLSFDLVAHAQENTHQNIPPVQFQKVQIASESYESVGVFDVNNDGELDIVSGSFWYEGPDFPKKDISEMWSGMANTGMILQPFPWM